MNIRFPNNFARAVTPRVSQWMLAVSTLSSVLLSGISIQAQATYNWTSAAPDNYTNPAAWDQNGVPGMLDTAIIGNATVANATVLYTNALSDPLSTNRLFYFEMGAASGTSTFEMSDGALWVTNTGAVFALGNASGAADTFNQDGGMLVVARPSSGNLYYQDGFFPGRVNGATGTYTINNGLLMILCGLEIGQNGSGVFNINGGTVIDNGWFGLRGGGTSTDSGTFNMTGGTLYVLRNKSTEGQSFSGLGFAQNGYSSTANISGGTAYFKKIAFGNNANANETLNMSGGTLYIGVEGVVSLGAAVSQTANISGGTFHTVDMLVISTTADCGNTNTILSDGTNWSWDASLPVNLTNNTMLVNGVGGPGYVTFAPEAGRTITLNNVWSGVGGLTLNGPGTVALNAANTYTGGTTISQGTLAFNNGGSILDSTITVASGATLDFNAGNVTQIFTNNVDGAGNLLVTLGSSGREVTSGDLGQSGSTLVRSGTLEVNGTLNNSSGIVVSNNATLSGGGQIGAPISLNPNAVLSTGTATAPGTLTAGDVTVGSGAALAMRIGHDTTPGNGVNDLLMAHNLTLAPDSVLNINALTTPSIGTYVLAQCSGTLTGTFGAVNGLRGANVVYNGNEVDLVVTSTNISSLAWNAPIGASNIAWDITTSSNWINTDTLQPAAFHQSDAVLFTSAAGTTNRVNITGAVSPSSITVSGGFPYLFSGLGYITGGASFTYNDTNVSGIYTSGNDYTGPVAINAGVLQLGIGGSQWLGVTNGATYVNGGTLDLNGQSVGKEPLVLQGAGMGGTNGAINNSSSSSPSQSGGPLNITLAGDTTINASGARWDIGVNSLGAGGGSFSGNGYALTKIGPMAIWMHEVGDLGVGDIFVNQGFLGFQFTVGLGDPTKTITVMPGATFGIWQVPNTISKQVVLDNGGNIYSYGGGKTNVINGTITLNGPANNQINNTGDPLNLLGPVVGSGGIQKIGVGPLYFQGINTYTGPTTISAGSIVLGPSGVFGPSTPVTIAAGASLDASASGGLTIGSGQIVSGFGGIAGNFTADATSMILPGGSVTPGTLTFSNNVTFNGVTNIIKLGNDPNTIGQGANDLLSVVGNLTLSGISTIQIAPIGLLDTNIVYTIIQYSGTLTGSAANLHVVCDNPNYTVSLVDPTTTPGYIAVNVTGSPADLVWQGTAVSNPNDWDHITTNWLNLETTAPASYSPGDNAIFDDTAAIKTINVLSTNIGSITMSNTADYMFTGPGFLGGTLDMEGSGTLTLSDAQPPLLSTITANSGNLVFDVPVAVYSNTASVSDNNGLNGGIQGGLGNLIKAGTNTLVMSGDNSLFTGTIVVNDGVLQYTTTSGIGAPGGPLYATNNGTLDLHGVSSGPKNINVSGTGYNGQGAVNNTGGSLVNQAGIYYLNFVGNATIGSTTRWDIYNNQINGNGYDVTKVGTGDVFFTGSLETGLGNLDVQAGRIGFQENITMGDPSKTVTIERGAALTFYGLVNQYSANGGEDKIAVLNGGNGVTTNGYAVMDSGGSSNNFNGPVTLVGTNNMFGVRSGLCLWDVVNGSGGFIVSGDYYAGSDHFSGGGNLYLEGANTYTGPTIISNNAVVVGTNSSLGASSLIWLNSGTRLDVTALTTFNLGSGQTLMGAGTVNGGNINLGNGATLIAGFLNANTYTLTVGNNLTLQSGSTDIVAVNKAGTVANSTVAGLNSVTLGGTLVITNMGGPLAGGDVIKVFSATNYSGSFANIIPATPGAGLTWDTSQLGVNGTLLVQGPAVDPNPTNIVFSVSGNQLTLSWPDNYIGWTLQAQTNALSVGISNDWVDVPGSTTTNKVVMPIDAENGAVFYRMILNP